MTATTARAMFDRQCRLTRGSVSQYAWIKEEGAHEGARVRLKSDDNELWLVESVGGRLGADRVQEAGNDHLHQRQASDV